MFTPGRLTRTFVLTALATSATYGCGQYMGASVASPPPSAGVSSDALTVEQAEFKIAPGDIISIETYGAPELTTSSQTSSGDIALSGSPLGLQGIKVDSSGSVSMAYVDSVKVAGLSPSEASLYLDEKLKQLGVLVDPQVTVRIVDSPTRVVSVIGEVTKPMPVPAFGKIRLLDAISACGGFTPLASHEVMIRRAASETSIAIELGTDPAQTADSNIRLMAGDTVIVPRVGSVFVVGYVKTPAAIPLSSNAPITVLRALALAGGVNYGAGLSKARIIRTTTDNQEVVIRLDLKKIMFGQSEDVALRSNDVLFIPANAFKAGMAGGGAGVVAALLYGVSGTASAFR